MVLLFISCYVTKVKLMALLNFEKMIFLYWDQIPEVAFTAFPKSSNGHFRMNFWARGSLAPRGKSPSWAKQQRTTLNIPFDENRSTAYLETTLKAFTFQNAKRHPFHIKITYIFSQICQQYLSTVSVNLNSESKVIFFFLYVVFLFHLRCHRNNLGWGTQF